MKQLYSFLFIAALPIIIICCSDNGVSTNNNNNPSVNITMTDTLGNILGGDTTQWCRKGVCNNIKPCFPNPVNNKFTFPFDVRLGPDTVSLFTIKNNDTIYLMKNKTFVAGSYLYSYWADSLNLHRETLRFYFKGKKSCPVTPPNCTDGGFVQFN